MVGRHLGPITESLRHTIRLDGLIAVGVAVLAAIIEREPAPRVFFTPRVPQTLVLSVSRHG
jgi:hypothetical protein